MNKVKNSGFKIIGLKLDKKTTNIGGQSSVDCGNLWQRFEKENLAEEIPNKVGDEIYAVYFDYEGDHTDPFSYFIGCKVTQGTKVPEGLDSLIIPEQNYHKVLAEGKIPDCISNSWKEIWNGGIQRTYKYDFEIYDERSRDWSNAEVAIYVACN